MTATPTEAFNARELAPRVESSLRIADRVYGRHRGYTRIRGALSNLGHAVARSTIANILREHGIEPASIVKAVRDLTDLVTAQALAERKAEYRATAPLDMPREELARLIKHLEKQMRSAAESMEFEKAAVIRDQIFEFRRTLADMDDLPPWQRVRAMSGETEVEL